MPFSSSRTLTVGLRVGALGHGIDLEELQRGGVGIELADGLEDGIHRAVAAWSSTLRSSPSTVERQVGGRARCRCRDSTRSALTEMRVLAAHDLVVDQGDDVLVEDMLLLVGQILEAAEGILEGVVVRAS